MYHTEHEEALPYFYGTNTKATWKTLLLTFPLSHIRFEQFSGPHSSVPRSVAAFMTQTNEIALAVVASAEVSASITHT